MKKKRAYTTKLGAGLGLVDETRKLLELWEEGMSSQKLYVRSLESGTFPNIAARRLVNIVKDCFAPRYLVQNGQPAQNLKVMLPVLTSSEFLQFLLLYTCRESSVLADFITDIYWVKYCAGYSEISNDDSRKFVETAVDRGLTTIEWADSMVKRVSSYLTGCCADYGLLEAGRKSSRKILPFRISPKMIVYLAYDLHFSGLGDNAVIGDEDWKLFGLNEDDVFNELKRLSADGDWIIQSAGGAVRIDWKYKTQEEVVNALSQK